MQSKTSMNAKSLDGLIKAMLVMARAAEHVLETRAVEVASGSSLSSSKVQIFRLLGQRGSQTSSQVAQFLGVSKPAISQIIDTMVRDKHVVRKTAKEDRREVNLLLTAKGKRIFQGVRREQRGFARGALKKAGLSNPDRWIKTLLEITNSLAQADKQFCEFCVQCGAHDEDSCVLKGGDSDCVFIQHNAASLRRAKMRKERD